MSTTRRDFLKKTGVAAAGISIGALGLSSKAFSSVLGANDRINIAVMGVNSRGAYLTQKFASAKNTHIKYICDVDSRALKRTVENVKKNFGYSPEGVNDFRKALDDSEVDLLVIAAPDHWHAPASIMALQAGKNVYVEKPCSHNAFEGEMLIRARDKYGKLVQMGNQQRSSVLSREAIQLIREGYIGEVYYGKAWYSNKRGPIGIGKKAPVPSWLDYELWQGPALRMPYMDNRIHYNWHWFWNYGTGELGNNATHELDICRWALNVDYPIRVSSHGGRLHYSDDWEFFDTQIANYEFKGGKTIVWDGKSCNPNPLYKRSRGSAIYGTKGTLIVDRSGYEFYDLNNKLIKEAKAGTKSTSRDLVGVGELDTYHVGNLLEAIRTGVKLNSPIEEGHKSVLLCHLGNIAQKQRKQLNCNPIDGMILHDKEAQSMWKRAYAKGWELKV